MFKKILIANDCSAGAFKALGAALSLAHSQKAPLHMISVDGLGCEMTGRATQNLPS